jgi:hypothetical protein
MPNKQEPLNIAGQFENAMERLKIYKDRVPAIQWQEMERAFYAGASSMLLLMSGPIPELPDRQAEMAFKKLLQEAEFFWRNALNSGFKMN